MKGSYDVVSIIGKSRTSIRITFILRSGRTDSFLTAVPKNYWTRWENLISCGAIKSSQRILESKKGVG